MYCRRFLPAVAFPLLSSPRLLFFCGFLSVCLLISGCGGGGSSASPATEQTLVPLDPMCSPDEFMPNYAKETYRLYRRLRLPLIVYFVEDEYFTPQRKEIVLRGLDQWVEAMHHPLFTYTLTHNPSRADTVVQFSVKQPKGIWAETSSRVRRGAGGLTERPQPFRVDFHAQDLVPHPGQPHTGDDPHIPAADDSDKRKRCNTDSRDEGAIKTL